MGVAASDEPHRCRIQVFGGLRIWHGPDELEAGPARRRALLAILLVSNGAVVSSDRLLHTLWPDEAPVSALNQLRRLVGELRRLMEPGLAVRSSGSHILAVGAGYRFEPMGIDTDLGSFRELLREGRVSITAGDRAAGISSIIQALDLARLPAFTDLDSEFREPSDAATLDRERAAACAFAIGLADGDTDPHLIALIETMAETMRLNESLQADLILLLARLGRRAEALNTYEEVRSMISDTLGVDPGAALRDAHTRALTWGSRHGATLGHAPAARQATVARVGSELPSHIGSDDRLLGSAIVVSGMTTLAIRWARDLWDDGQMYLNLRAFDARDNPVGPQEALAALLAAMGVPI